MIKKFKAILVVIIVLAALLRFYKLGENPPSINWDEASLGYNAYSLLKTGRDEYGNTWPLSIRSFNDYKPPAYVYLTIPSVAIFGLNEFAVRFPSALVGTLTVFVIFFISNELFTNKRKIAKSKELKYLPAVTAFLLAINPWHIQFSRIAFEANLALGLFTLGIYFLLKALHKNSTHNYIVSAIAFALTMYSYHSARLIVPLFLLALTIIYHKQIRKNSKKVFWGLAVGIILLLPSAIIIFRGSAQARFSTVSVFTNRGIYTQEQDRFQRQDLYKIKDITKKSLLSITHHPWLVLSKLVAEGYLDHFNIKYLFIEGDDIGRHSVAGMGLMYFWELPLLLTGAYLLISEKNKANLIIIPWLLLAPTASALTTHTPHAVRSLFMLPPLILISSYGALHIIKLFQKRYLILVIISIIVVSNLLYYLDLYFIHTPIERSFDWKYGYKQLVEKVGRLEKDYEEIIISTNYDQPHIFFLFYNKVDPSWYQSRAENGAKGFGKYIFRAIEYRRDRELPNRLIVGVPKEIPDDAPIIDKIQFLDGSTAFLIVKS